MGIQIDYLNLGRKVYDTGSQAEGDHRKAYYYNGFFPAEAQQLQLPKIVAEVLRSAVGNTMTKAYAQTIGRIAYMWGYAIVNSHNRRLAFAYVSSKHWRPS